MKNMTLLELSPVDSKMIEDDLELWKAVKSFRAMSLGWKGAVTIRNRYGLGQYFDAFERLNTARLAPYHNEYHSICMVLNCYEGAYHEKLDDEDIKPLIIAALFHDFNHSAGTAPSDDDNIAVAIQGLRAVHASVKTIYPNVALSEEDLELAIKTIKVTRFPFIYEPVSLLEQIIRDADLMQAYEPNPVVMYKQFRGLITELVTARKVKITDKEFGEGNRKFYDSLEWFTAWASLKAVLLDFEGIKERQAEMFTKFR